MTVPAPALTADLRRDLVHLRRDLHRHPEVAHQERRTAALVAERLRRLGLSDVRTGVGETGVVGVLRGGRPGRTVLLRADMDALPLAEADRGQAYRSADPGVHHACGHDGHVAILLTVAALLAEARADLPGTVSLVFQPAEERVGGAEGMLRDGALDPRPDACFGLHLWNDMPVGRVDARPGPVFASADAFAVDLRGSGGHAASPHQVGDPIAACAYLVTLLQTLVSRHTPPLEPAALTIGSIHGGTAPNIIPHHVELQGTLRTFDREVRARLLRQVETTVQATAGLFGLEADLRLTDACPACVNDPEMARLVQRVAGQVLGPSMVSDVVRTTGADDMALFLDAAPGCYFFVGSANAERGLASPHHSPTFDFDERALEVGVNVLLGAALEYLAS